MKSKLHLSAILIITVLISLPVKAQEVYNLSYKLEKGKTYLYGFKMDMDMTQSMAGQDMKMQIQSKMQMRMEVIDVTKDNIEIINSIDSVYSKSTNPMGGDDVVNHGEGIVGKKSKIIYDIFGKSIKKVEIDKIETGMNFNMSTTSEGLFRLSNKPVKIGEIWNSLDTNKISIGDSGTMLMILSTELKLVGKELFNGVECLKIAYNQKTKIEGSFSMQGVNAVIEGGGNTQGSCYFDYKLGVMKSNENITELNQTVAMPDQNITIPMNQKVKTTMTLLK